MTHQSDLKSRLRSIMSAIAAHPGRNFVIMMSLLVVLGLNWWFPFLRFTAPPLNALVGLILILLPIALLLNSFLIRNRVARIVSFIVFGMYLPIASWTVAIGFFTLADTVAWGHDPGFEPIRTLAMEESMVVAYRTNPGAMGSFGITVQQEKRIIPGLKLVHHLYARSHCYDVTLQRVPPDSVRIDTSVVAVKPRVYF